ncbi:FUSC family protein [Acinetobacter shaoyimingii]|uniref:FUSC family protein n=1 Tax=Acinetobacter shaoyimingii TaxID=2715164 RepID=A0A6G8RWU9_9GAMM|nr:FUSC family protein [Acinetobacter shaoyimingii]NHB57811.1 FUSC family protein [Acinetobacter shaoyimingii]QIO06416.1 FUSC family protein [Acinetobacter shaoyimingii]
MLLTKHLFALRPSKSDWIFAIKTFFAGILALYIAFSLDLTYPVWSITTVFIIANPYAGMSASKSFFRVLGTSVGATVSILVTPLLIHTPWLFTLFLAVWVSGCLFVSLLDRTPRSYAFLLAGYTTVIISFTIINNVDTSSVFELALGRFIEICVGVVCSAIASLAILPMNFGPAVENQVSRIFKDTRNIFDKIFLDDDEVRTYNQSLNKITADIANLHTLAIHLSYERSKLKGMTRPVQEMLHQLSMLVANMVAMAEKIKQLDQINPLYRQQLPDIHAHIVTFLKSPEIQTSPELNILPDNFEQDFKRLFSHTTEEQQILVAGLKMDIRHFIQNFHAISLMWKRIQAGNFSLPEILLPLRVKSPHLHRDYAMATRGSISAFIVVMLSGAIWISSGWYSGYMMAEMAAVTACILTSMDNPVPALKMFMRGNIYAAIIVFIYLFGVLPQVTEYWQLAVVLAPAFIGCLLLYPHPPLTALGVPMMIGLTMGLGFHNHYQANLVSYFDASMAMIFGPAISIWVMRVVRSISPDMSAQRLLASHYKAVRKTLYIPYGEHFRIHLRAMLDRIGVLNSKSVQSPTLKNKINLAIIECSAIVDLARIQELIVLLPKNHAIVLNLEELTILMDDYLRAKEYKQDFEAYQIKLIEKIQQLNLATDAVQDLNISERLQISLINIRNSLCHVDQPNQMAS